MKHFTTLHKMKRCDHDVSMISILRDYKGRMKLNTSNEAFYGSLTRKKTTLGQNAS